MDKFIKAFAFSALHVSISVTAASIIDPFFDVSLPYPYSLLSISVPQFPSVNENY
jgi:hypothetical protein